MGRVNVLVEGVSGAGKTSVAAELERRGEHVVHGTAHSPTRAIR